ncbi:phage antirepressor KilAC domain-containing protein [Campylobacter lanienae]|uniref:phage antirepressor KilAC domain-containing protein n=1 Tax=Campylobacter lanienae TaxID=75658 RepID=UPI00242DFE2B|nr:phage antirepressor KilAC domain-containing protein [Campylobacter lanienae]MDD5785998.1 phage antirepressor KilAC domain-containing protein [Campylobacter lanienae]
MQDLTIFKNENLGEVRVIYKDNEVLFCLADICRALNIQNPTIVANAIKSEFELPKFNIGSFDTGYGVKEFTMITEPQLYFVLMRSDKPTAKEFRKWVNTEVLPSIRKTGAYSIQQQIPKTYGEALLEAGRLALENERLLTQAKENQPKIEAFNELMSSNDSLDFLTFSKVIKMGRNTLFKKLRELQILRQDNTPYQKYVDRGYFKVVETTYRYSENQKVGINYKTIIYPKGQTFIINLLKNPTKGE